MMGCRMCWYINSLTASVAHIYTAPVIVVGDGIVWQPRRPPCC